VANARLPAPSATRERLVAAALRLFAENGYRGTTVGEIEAAAGLSPRAGAFYKHFRSKEDVLEAALDEGVRAVEGLADVTALLPLGDDRADLTVLARWALRQLRHHLDFWNVLRQEARTFPDLVARAHERLVRRVYADGAALMRSTLEERGLHDVDARALAAVVLGALANYRLEEALWGEPPAGVTEDRFVKTLVDLCVTYLQRPAAPREDRPVAPKRRRR